MSNETPSPDQKRPEGGSGISRRTFLGRLIAGIGLLAAAGGGYLSLRKTPRTAADIGGRILGASAKVGHQLRSPQPFAPTETQQAQIVIIGAGAAGLSAAYALLKAGIKDFVVLDLEEKPGGNASSGQNAVSAYPWGAHYVPIPDPGNAELIQLFEELGIITGWVLNKPLYREEYLCQAPHERLLIHGSWQEGLVPKLGVPKEELSQIHAFEAEMARLKHASGTDGKPAFAIPVARSSQDPQFQGLDQQTMGDYLRAKGWDSAHLHWYVDYCCRDDFGTTVEATSAWAGIHYFAARAGVAANATDSDVLTWPEGNGWLMARLAERIGPRIRCGQLVRAVRNTPTGVEVDVVAVADGRQVRFQAAQAIFAGPRFVAGHVVEGLGPAPEFSYAPWVVANVTLSQRPIGRGAPLSWDNVAYGSRSLGYIVADHQSLLGHNPEKTVLTWYEPLTQDAPAVARGKALKADHAYWKDYVLADLENMHPGITEQVETIDIWVWGHGMIRPVPGFVSGTARKAAAQPLGKIHFAHTDMSGLSIFEEAFYWGQRAAEAVVQASQG
jgi:hypothetical protein